MYSVFLVQCFKHCALMLLFYGDVDGLQFQVFVIILLSLLFVIFSIFSFVRLRILCYYNAVVSKRLIYLSIYLLAMLSVTVVLAVLFIVILGAGRVWLNQIGSLPSCDFCKSIKRLPCTCFPLLLPQWSSSSSPPSPFLSVFFLHLSITVLLTLFLCFSFLLLLSFSLLLLIYTSRFPLPILFMDVLFLSSYLYLLALPFPPSLPSFHSSIPSQFPSWLLPPLPLLLLIM